MNNIKIQNIKNTHQTKKLYTHAKQSGNSDEYTLAR